VLSIGSGGDIDKEGQRYRDYFRLAAVYVTSDIDPKMRCDLLLDAQGMPSIASESFDAVFCSGVLEHVEAPWRVAGEVFRVLKPGGVFLVGVPFKQPVHRAPFDYWRFTAYGIRSLLKAFSVQDVKPVGDPAFPFAHWVRAVKPVLVKRRAA
jgi:ubiquinone/menaquinone biosynthesis C-methylase UbiE